MSLGQRLISTSQQRQLRHLNWRRKTNVITLTTHYFKENVMRVLTFRLKSKKFFISDSEVTLWSQAQCLMQNKLWRSQKEKKQSKNSPILCHNFLSKYNCRKLTAAFSNIRRLSECSANSNSPSSILLSQLHNIHVVFHTSFECLFTRYWSVRGHQEALHYSTCLSKIAC